MALPAERLSERDLNDSLSSKELVERGVEAQRSEMIPLDNVMIDSSLFDAHHVKELGDSMKKKRGQVSPITVRAKMDERKEAVVYDVIDGFHRTQAGKANGKADIRAEVLYGCDDEELADKSPCCKFCPFCPVCAYGQVDE